MRQQLFSIARGEPARIVAYWKRRRKDLRIVADGKEVARFAKLADAKEIQSVALTCDRTLTFQTWGSTYSGNLFNLCIDGIPLASSLHGSGGRLRTVGKGMRQIAMTNFIFGLFAMVSGLLLDALTPISRTSAFGDSWFTLLAFIASCILMSCLGAEGRHLQRYLS